MTEIKIMDIQKIIEHDDMRYTYVNGYERNYRIYIDGEIWSVRSEKFLKQEISKGYKRVTLSINGKTKRFQVHRLVAMYFIENKLNRPCVNHIDGDKQNNNFNNLEWCTHSENENHSYNVLGKINPIRKLSELDVIDIRKNCIKGVNNKKKGNVLDFMLKYMVDRSTILNVLKNKYYV
jgi:hypothetical protein